MTTAHWTQAEIGVLTRTVASTPSVHGTMPWELEMHGDHAELYERQTRALAYHDPTGRDRLLSCGAALANLVAGVRLLGWVPEVRVFPDLERPDLVARVSAVGRDSVSEHEVARFWAILHRHSYRRPFAGTPVAPTEVAAAVNAIGADGVRAHLVSQEQCADLAKLFCYAANVLRSDAGYQRELAAWTAPSGADGLAPGVPGADTLPWAGLVRASTRLPDAEKLADRLRQEVLLIFVTEGDEATDHIAAGAAAERSWLTALTNGLVGSVITQPLRLSEVRHGVMDQLGLNGYPQLVLRLGHPVLVNPEESSAAAPAY